MNTEKGLLHTAEQGGRAIARGRSKLIWVRHASGSKYGWGGEEAMVHIFYMHCQHSNLKALSSLSLMSGNWHSHRAESF